MTKLEEKQFFEKFKRTYHELGKIENPSEELCLKCIKHEPVSYHLLKNPTLKVTLAAVRLYSSALGDVEHQTEEICIAAVKSYFRALLYVRKMTLEICYQAINKEEFPYGNKEFLKMNEDQLKAHFGPFAKKTFKETCDSIKKKRSLISKISDL